MSIPTDILDPKLKDIHHQVYDTLFHQIYNYPESNLLTHIKLGYAYQTPIITRKGSPVTGIVIAKTNLILHIKADETVVLLHANLSNTNGLIYTNTISPYYRGEWIKASDLINNQYVTLELCSFNGLVIPYSNIEVKSSLTNNNVLYIKVHLRALMDIGLKFGDNLFMKLYLNDKVSSNFHNTPKEIYTFDYQSNSNDDLLTLRNIINSQYDHLTDIVYINGKMIYDLSLVNRYINDYLNNNDSNNPLYIDYIKDHTIQHEYEFNNFHDKIFTSNTNNEERYLLHPNLSFINDIQKKIKTFDQIDFYLIDKESNQGIRISYIIKDLILNQFKDISPYTSVNDVLIQLIEKSYPSNILNSIIYQYEYFNKNNIGNTIQQVSEFDYSVSKEYIDYIKSSLNYNSNRFVILAKYKNYNKSQSFKPNSNLTEWLYSNLNDNEIITSLLNQNTTDILNEIYKADQLEISHYTKSLFKLPNKYNTKEIIQQAIDSYGFLPFNNEFCRTIYEFLITDPNQNTFTIEKSVFYQNEKCSILLYINGKLITSGYSYNDHLTTIDITINTSINPLQINDDILIRVIPFNKFEDPIFLEQLFMLSPDQPQSSILVHHAYDYSSFTPNDLNNIFIIDKKEIIPENFHTSLYTYDVYLVKPIKSSYPGYDGVKLPNRYIKLDPYHNPYFTIVEDHTNHTINYFFNEDSYDHTFIFVPKDYYSLHIKKYHIPKPNVVPINFLLTFNEIPILNLDHITIYVNGKEIYHMTDYIIHEIKNNDDSISGYWFVLQSHRYLESFNNIDIIITSEREYDITSEYWFGTDHYISTNQRLNIKDRRCCLMSVNGKTLTQYTSNILDGNIDVYDDVDKKIYKLRYLIPKFIYQHFRHHDDSTLTSLLGNDDVPGLYASPAFQPNSYNFNDDYSNKLDRLLSEGYSLLCHDPEDVKRIENNRIVAYHPYSETNQVISSYGSKIVELILNGDIQLIDGMSDEQLELILQPYEYLKKYDLLFYENNLIYKSIFSIIVSLYNQTSILYSLLNMEPDDLQNSILIQILESSIEKSKQDYLLGLTPANPQNSILVKFPYSFQDDLETIPDELKDELERLLNIIQSQFIIHTLDP